MSTETLEFDQIIAPIGRAAFLSDYWNKQFLRLPGTPGRFTSLLTWDELNRMLEQHRLAPPRFRLFQDGRAIDPANYLITGLGGESRVHLGMLTGCLVQGATMIIDQVEEMAPRVRTLAHSLQKALHTGNYVNLYAGWHTQEGFDLHWDDQDTFILQLSGRKNWKIYKPTRKYPLKSDIEKPPLPTDKPVWEGILQDGDAFYIPRGWWHVANPVNEPSLHITMATVPPNGVDLLKWVVENLRRDVDVRRDLPFSNDAQSQEALLARLRNLLSAELNGQVVDDFRREWEARFYPQPLIRLPSAPYVQTAAITTQTRIRLAWMNRLFFEYPADGQMVYFFANYVRWACPAHLVPALAMLSDAADLPLTALSEKLPDGNAIEDLKLSLAELAKAGIVLLRND